MAKKIRIEDSADQNDHSRNNISNSIPERNSDTLKAISIIINIVLVITIFVLISIFNNKTSTLKNEIEEYKTEQEEKTCAYETEFACMFEHSTEIGKAKFLDENIVFVLEGYGNVYYTYDCVTKLTDGEEYSYWAYNKEAAISQGYKSGKC